MMRFLHHRVNIRLKPHSHSVQIIKMKSDAQDADVGGPETVVVIGSRLRGLDTWGSPSAEFPSGQRALFSYGMA